MSDTIDFGIDLGTTNSSIALCRDGDVKVFQTTDLMNVVPSVVYVSKSGRMLVGKRAYDAWVADPDNTQAEFKRWMGFSDRLNFPASGKSLSAEELSAEVLKLLRGDAERQSGEKINSAVITVPAAFGGLQCEATGRAARLAGFEQAVLLQEPIAAAVAYGASPSSQDQRWMVFDLGGGTLDIAVVSTRDGRLAVLDHQGNNRLGGKDVDRAIAKQAIWQPLSQAFNLPTAETNPAAYSRLMRAVIRQAEIAKIALSVSDETTIDLFDVGDDNDGKPIELTLPLKRAEVESLLTPFLDDCLMLVRKALDGARVNAADLDKVLLVGGPTKIPAVRAALVSLLGEKLDHTLDPMTAVSHGAALYASTQPKTTVAPAAAPTVAPGKVKLELAYERASGTATSPVAVLCDPSSPVAEIKIESSGGIWTSGWIAMAGGCAQTEVLLNDRKPSTRFTVSARDAKGSTVEAEPASFTITFMLPMAAPPLPHTIAVELTTADGVTKLDPVFERHIPLPAEVRKTYTADRTLRPSEIDATLPIKFWETDVSDDPTEKWWAGCVHVRADKIKRPIPEGSPLELVIRIDTSRKISAEVFVPVLNQAFTDDVYVPDPPTARSQLRQQLDACFDRLNAVREEMYLADQPDLLPQLKAIESAAENLAERVAAVERVAEDDPDASAGLSTDVRRIRLRITQIEEQLGVGSAAPSLDRKLRSDFIYIQHLVQYRGSDAAKTQLQKLHEQYEAFHDADDARGLRWVHDEVWKIHWLIVRDADWYWFERFEALKRPGRRFVNEQRAAQLIAQGDAAVKAGHVANARGAVTELWKLLPDNSQAAREVEAASGLRMG